MLFLLLSKLTPRRTPNERYQKNRVKKLATLALNQYKIKNGVPLDRKQTLYVRDFMILPPLQHILNKTKAPSRTLMEKKDAFVNAVVNLKDLKQATIEQALQSLFVGRSKKTNRGIPPSEIDSRARKAPRHTYAETRAGG